MSIIAQSHARECERHSNHVIASDFPASRQGQSVNQTARQQQGTAGHN